MWLNKTVRQEILKIFHMNTKFRSFALTILAINLTSCEEPKREVHSEVLGDLNPISHDDRLTSNENKSITVRQEDLAYSLMDADREIFECALEVTDISSAKVAVTKLSRIEKRLKDIYDELQTMTPPSDEIKYKIKRKTDEHNKAMLALQPKVNKGIKSLDPVAHKMIIEGVMKCSGVITDNRKEFQRHFAVEQE